MFEPSTSMATLYILKSSRCCSNFDQQNRVQNAKSPPALFLLVVDVETLPKLLWFWHRSVHHWYYVPQSKKNGVSINKRLGTQCLVIWKSKNPGLEFGRASFGNVPFPSRNIRLVEWNHVRVQSASGDPILPSN